MASARAAAPARAAAALLILRLSRAVNDVTGMMITR
jgi:hypothetical protein